MTLQPSNEPSTPPINIYNNVVYLPPLCAMAVTRTEALDIDEMAVYEECVRCVLAIRRVYTLKQCGTCDGKGGTTSGEMQGDGYMTGWVEFFEPCYACIDKGLCPNCGVATLNAEAQADIGSFTCVICDWTYEKYNQPYDDEPSMHDFDDFEADDRPYDDAYEGPPGSGLGYQQ